MPPGASRALPTPDSALRPPGPAGPSPRRTAPRAPRGQQGPPHIDACGAGCSFSHAQASSRHTFLLPLLTSPEKLLFGFVLLCF